MSRMVADVSVITVFATDAVDMLCPFRRKRQICGNRLREIIRVLSDVPAAKVQTVLCRIVGLYDCCTLRTHL